jgi:transposase
MILKQNVGIDVSMESFDVNLTVLDNEFKKQCLGSRKFNNDLEGFKALTGWVNKRRDEHVKVSYTMEFTGVYYEQLAYFLRSGGELIYMVIPSKAKKYCQSLSCASKTDKLDARSLSWMGLERELRAWEPLSQLFLNMRNLTREREELLKERTMTKNRMHSSKKQALGQVNSVRRYQDRIAMLNAQIEEIEDELMELLKEDKEVYAKYKNITTIPGVAFITATTIIAETNGFAAILNQKQLTSYAGYDVKFNESGKFKGKAKISKQGNAHIRRALHFPAQTAVVHNKPLSMFYERVNERKEKSMIAGVAVQRKILCLIYTLWKTDKTFDPYYEINKYRETLKKVG